MTAVRVKVQEVTTRMASKLVAPELQLEVLSTTLRTDVVVPQLKLEAKAEAV